MNLKVYILALQLCEYALSRYGNHQSGNSDAVNHGVIPHLIGIINKVIQIIMVIVFRNIILIVAFQNFYFLSEISVHVENRSASFIIVFKNERKIVLKL